MVQQQEEKWVCFDHKKKKKTFGSKIDGVSNLPSKQKKNDSKLRNHKCFFFQFTQFFKHSWPGKKNIDSKNKKWI